jgi:DNA-binding NarL/FixJ family response regulator
MMICAMNVLIVDDHPLYREGLKALLCGLDPGLRVVCVSRVADAPAAVAGLALELVLLDMNLPGASRLDALNEVRGLFEGASIVVVSGEEDADLMLSVVDAGAAGYIPKSAEPDVTIQALRVVLAQGIYLPPAALRHAVRRATAPAPVPTPGPVISKKQQEVLARLLQGKSNKVIARELDIADGTVKAHLSAVYSALGVNSRSQAMCKAYELGLLRQ